MNQSKAFFTILVSALFIFSITGGAIFADAVPQKIGFKDVPFSALVKKNCTDCHGESLVDDHHGTSQAKSGNCVHCHGVNKTPGKIGVSLNRDCMKCHQKSPHHKTQAAIDKECGTCHESPGISEYSTKVPAYKISKVTPTVDNCRTCHDDGTVDGIKVSGMKKTHHGISLKGCNVCHDQTDKKSKNIRLCQRCHSVKALHEVLPHVEKQNCVICHGGKPKVAPPKAKAPAAQKPAGGTS